jgi:hypothetical protein
MQTILHPKAMTTVEAAKYLITSGHRTTSKTLEVWRCKKRGPKYKKVGSRVYYEQSWLDEFMAGIKVKIFDPARM